MERRRLLGVFAHPDDEVFCAGGTLAKYVAAGAEAMVVSATRGEAGQIRDAAVATRATLGPVREQELNAACACLGVQHVQFLDYIDGTLATVDGAVLTSQVEAIIADFRPDVIITFGHDGAYGHPDHVTIGDVTANAARQCPARLYFSHFPRSRLLLLDRLAQWLTELDDRFKGAPEFASAFSLFTQETNTLGFANDHINVAWYPPGVAIVEQGEPAVSLYLVLSGHCEISRDGADGRREVLSRLGPGEFFGELALAHGTVRNAHVVALEPVTCLVFSPGTPTPFAGRGDESDLARTAPTGDSTVQTPATTVVDVSSVLDRKMAAIAAHRSQYPIDIEMFPPWMLQEMMGHEHFMRIRPAVRPEDDLFA